MKSGIIDKIVKYLVKLDKAMTINVACRMTNENIKGVQIMKMDCSKTNNYLREKGRILESIRHNCLSCPLASKHNGTSFTCCVFEGKYPDKAISIVQKWSDEHQRKTYKEDFFEKFPDAPREKGGYPKVVPCSIYKELCYNGCRCCDNCWDRVMEECK